MTDDEVQKQLTVYGRAPLQIHRESWSVNERGVHERFLNDGEQVTVRLDYIYSTGNTTGDVERVHKYGIILFSDDRRAKVFTVGFLEGYEPKPPGEYPITEAFQTIVGDFTMPWETESRMFFQNTPRWDYPRLFRSTQFRLHEYIDSEKFANFHQRVKKLDKATARFLSVRTAHDKLIESEEFELAILIDCGLLKEYGGNFANPAMTA
ncbi:MAG: hypothetical protein HY513_00325 [Candidatus Aenigmarchaeota archaeon]|nr:hypothetical protein [Candidatus Aenigmarchaeota archaeon]